MSHRMAASGTWALPPECAMTDGRNTALIAGATGAVARRLVQHLLAQGWNVVGLCRIPPANPDGARYSRSTCSMASDAQGAGTGAGYHARLLRARARHGEGGVESVEENVAMLRTSSRRPRRRRPPAARASGRGRQVVRHALGAFPTPAREDDPRHMPPNFYYDQEDLLRARQKGKRWTWSASRPNVVSDFAPERARNLVADDRRLGGDLPRARHGARFPWHGRQPTGALTEITDAEAAGPRPCASWRRRRACGNEAFNVTNGDVIRWEQMWPRVAERFYGMKTGCVRPLKLAQWMHDKGTVWDRIVARHRLAPRTASRRWRCGASPTSSCARATT